MLETLDPETRQRVVFLHRHVVEVLTGSPPASATDDDDDETVVRPEYDVRRPLKDRIDAKVAELAAAGTPVGFRSLERYINAYRSDGVAGLVDGRSTKQASPTGRIDPALVSLLEQRDRRADHPVDGDPVTGDPAGEHGSRAAGVGDPVAPHPVPGAGQPRRLSAPVRPRHDPAHPGQPPGSPVGCGNPRHVPANSSKSTAHRWI